MSVNKIQKNITYSRRNWSGYLRMFGKFLYTERIHYYYLYKLLKTLSLNKNTILLDIGFGSGYNIKKISKKYHIKTIGCDIVQETIDKYNQQHIKNSHAIKINAKNQTISIEDKSIDIIVCSHVLEHVPDDTILLKEIFRLLKDTGVAYLNVPINEDTIDVPLHLRKYTTTNFIKLLQKYKFQIISKKESDIFTRYISYLGVHQSFVNNILKKTLIAFLSIFPIGLLEKLPGKKSQFICIVKKK